MFRKGLIKGLLLITMPVFIFNAFTLAGSSIKVSAAENPNWSMVRVLCRGFLIAPLTGLIGHLAKDESR